MNVAMLDDLYVTSELARRPARRTNYLREKRAIQELASRMADRPEEILPLFVDLAMEMTGGVAAGVSLFEPDSAPGVFRWKYLRGLLAPFENATTPRNHSPCGVTLDEDRPVLSRHPERFYDWIADANIIVPEVLLVPLRVYGGEALGTLWIVSDSVDHFDSGHAREMTDLATFVGIAVRMRQTQLDLEAALEQQETLTREMSHRLKNVFALSQGMLRLSARSATSKEELVDVVSGRISALAAAHSLVRRSLSDLANGESAPDLRSILNAVTLPHDAVASPSRIKLLGPEIHCGEKAVNGIALIFHELATNAAKYGALKSADGEVRVTWEQAGGELVVMWSEHAPDIPFANPGKAGFGAKLIQDTVTRQFAGAFDQKWSANALEITIALPLPSLSA